MEGLLIFGFIIGSLAMLGTLAFRVGVDSRERALDPHRPASASAPRRWGGRSATCVPAPWRLVTYPASAKRR